jgi:hypothetical protein
MDFGPNKWKKYVRYNREFVIIEFVITEFDITEFVITEFVITEFHSYSLGVIQKIRVQMGGGGGGIAK